MKISILMASTGNRIVNRDYNGGFGTSFSVGRSLRAKMLERLRKNNENLPVLTLGYLAAIFRQRGFSVEVLQNTVPDSGVVVVMPSLANFKKDTDLMQRAHANKNLQIVAVGALATTMPELFLDKAHCVVVGEPETFFRSVDIDEIPSGQVTSAMIKDLDTLPFPNWDVFDYKKRSMSLVFGSKPMAFVQMSRSCPYRCGYCPYIIKTKYRKRTVDSVIQEIEYLQRQFGISKIAFRDPTFTLERDRILEFCQKIEQNKININWICETRLDHLDEELIEAMKKSGLRAIKVGIEAVDEMVLKDANRKLIDLHHQEKIVNFCKQNNIKIIAFYIIGLPGEDKKTIESTINYAKKLNTFVAQFHICTPLPGTALYDQLKGKIKTNDWDKFNNFEVVFKHDKLSEREIMDLKEYAFVSYYFRWRYILSFFKSMVFR